MGDDRNAHGSAGFRGCGEQPVEAELLLHRHAGAGAVEQVLVEQHVAARVAIGLRQGRQGKAGDECQQQRDKRPQPHDAAFPPSCSGRARRLSVQAAAMISAPITSAITAPTERPPPLAGSAGPEERSAAASADAGIG